MSDSLLDRVQQVFREVFGDAGLTVHPSTTANDISGWDSLTHMTLIDALENHFSVRFTFDEVSGLNNVGDIISLLDKKAGS